MKRSEMQSNRSGWASLTFAARVTLGSVLFTACSNGAQDDVATSVTVASSTAPSTESPVAPGGVSGAGSAGGPSSSTSAGGAGAGQGGTDGAAGGSGPGGSGAAGQASGGPSGSTSADGASAGQGGTGGAAASAGLSGAGGESGGMGGVPVGSGGGEQTGGTSGSESSGGEAGAGLGGAAAAGSGGQGGGGLGGASGGRGEGGSVSGGGGQGGTSGAGTGGSAGATGSDAVDVFGIRRLYPSAASSAEWTSQHWGSMSYAITGRTDPNDPLAISGMRGTGTLQVTGDGQLVMGGSEPRIYIYPGTTDPWKNLEITVYYQRVSDSATAYAGLVVGARSGAEGHTGSTACEAHTYYARLRNDGAFDFEKELKHPASSTRARVQPATAWPPNGQVPLDTWIGFKFVIYNLPAENGVKLEAYRDLSGGAEGGTWVLVNETVDSGEWFTDTDCAEHSPNDGRSDLVVVEGGTTFIRNTNVTEARYRWLTVREIDPP